MTDKDFLRNLRIPTIENPLRILTSACLVGRNCGVDGTSNGEYPNILKLNEYENVNLVTFCPEDFAFGTPRETPDITGGNGHDVLDGNGHDVLDGKAKVITETGRDITSGMVDASLKMLQVAREFKVELAVLMDVSGACGSQVIYKGSRFAENPVYQIGMGVCAAQLDRHGINVISQRDFASLEILFSKIDPDHVQNTDAIDHNENEWYLEYFKSELTQG